MSGHRSSRRREYGRRQKDVRARRGEAPPIDLDAPTLWARGRGWDTTGERPALAQQPRFGERPSADGRTDHGQDR